VAVVVLEIGLAVAALGAIYLQRLRLLLPALTQWLLAQAGLVRVQVLWVLMGITVQPLALLQLAAAVAAVTMLVTQALPVALVAAVLLTEEGALVLQGKVLREPTAIAGTHSKVAGVAVQAKLGKHKLAATVRRG
jgi:hypothetical protein